MSYFSLYFNIISLSNIHSPQVPEPAEEGEILDDDDAVADDDDDAVADDEGDTEDHDSSLNTQCKNDFKECLNNCKLYFQMTLIHTNLIEHTVPTLALPHCLF